VTAVASLLFLAAGGLEAIVHSVASSPAHAGQLALLGPTLVEYGTSALAHGLALAAPIVLAALIGNVGLALISRAAPAANVFSIALAGVLVIGGIVLVATTTELIGAIFDDAQRAVSVLLTGTT